VDDKSILIEKYIAPPFSYFDSRQGYWRDRKKKWIELLGNVIAEGDGVSFPGMTDWAANVNNGKSVFDPVLIEISLRWFNKPNGRVLDPYGGEVNKGAICGYLGYDYTGIEIREDQCQSNRNTVKEMPLKKMPVWIRGDSRYMDQYIGDEKFDFVITSPPYFNLERYSKTEGDLSNKQRYDEFISDYEKIIKQTIAHLNNNRFIVWKVGDVRDRKTGFYYNFPGDTKRIFLENGVGLLNEIILITPVGTGARRAHGNFKNRKMVTLHQYVQIYYKSDTSMNIQDIFGTEIDKSNPFVHIAQIKEDYL